jgi:hypothetical protein
LLLNSLEIKDAIINYNIKIAKISSYKKEETLRIATKNFLRKLPEIIRVALANIAYVNKEGLKKKS